jgi:hypothetical protein
VDLFDSNNNGSSAEASAIITVDDAAGHEGVLDYIVRHSTSSHPINTTRRLRLRRGMLSISFQNTAPCCDTPETKVRHDSDRSMT